MIIFSSGDAGSPIFFSGQLIGIASWVEPCTGGQTNVNTRISAYRDFIEEVLNNSSLSLVKGQWGIIFLAAMWSAMWSM